MSYSFPYGNPNTSTNTAINNTQFNEYTYPASRHNNTDSHLYSISQPQQLAHQQQQQQQQQQNTANNYQPQQQFYPQVHPNDTNRPAEMNYPPPPRFPPAPFMAERPTGPTQFTPRQPQGGYFVQRLPYHPSMIPVDGYGQALQFQTRPVPIQLPNGMVNQMQPHVGATPPFYDSAFAQQNQTLSQVPYTQQYPQFYMTQPPQQTWNPPPNGQNGPIQGMSGQIPNQIQQQRYQQDTTQQPAIIQSTQQTQQPTPQQPQQQQPIPIVQPTIVPQPVVPQLPPTQQYVKRERKPLLIVNPDTNQAVDVKTTDNVPSGSQTATNRPVMNNSISLHSISTHTQNSNLPSKPFVSNTSATTTPAATSTSNAPTTTTTETTVASTTTTTTTNVEDAKNKQSIQNDFARNVLRRQTEVEKEINQQKNAAVNVSQTTDVVNKTVTETQPTVEVPKPVTVEEPVTTETAVNRAATEVPKSAVAIGPRVGQPTPAVATTQQQPTVAPLATLKQNSTKLVQDNTVDNKLKDNQTQDVQPEKQASTYIVKETNKSSSRANSQSPSSKNRVQVSNQEKEVESKPLKEDPAEPKPTEEIVKETEDESAKSNLESSENAKPTTQLISEETPKPTPTQETNSTETSTDDKEFLLRMRGRNSFDGTIWTPEQQEAKKRYNRDFLLSMQYKQLAATKPVGLPIIPQVIIDEPSKSQGIRHGGSLGSQRGRGGSSSSGRGGHGSSRGGYGGGGAGYSGGNIHQTQINIPNYNQEVKLHQLPVEERYRPAINNPALEGTTEKVLRLVRGILNRLTPQKFQKLASDLVALEINTEERLKGIIDIIFEKAIDEPGFSQTYANLCKILATIKVASDGDGKTLAFRTLLLYRCQKEFETDFYKEINYDELSKVVEECTDENKKKELREELEEKLSKAKRRSLGNIRFIGELFKLNMLTEVIMNDCINRLLKQESDEENLECLCRLLTTIGKDIDKPSNSKQMKDHFERLSKIKSRTPPVISARIRFMILDVIELRANEWVPRRKDNAPKTIDEIHREVEEEQLRSQIEIAKLQQNEQNKRSSIGQGPKGGKMFAQQSTLKSTSMDAEYANRSKQNMANKIKDMKSITSSNNTEILLGPPRFSKGASISKPTESSQTRAPQITSQQSSDHDDRRGSMPAYGNKPKTYMQQTSTDIKKDKKLENVRQMDRSYQNRSEASSRASSRDTSASRPSDSRDNSVTRASDSPVGDSNTASQKPKKNYSSKEIERLSHNMIDEYLNNDDINEALKDFEDFNPINSEQFDTFVRNSIEHILEKTQQIRSQVGKLFYRALKDKKLELNSFVGGLKSVVETAEDLVIDVPQVGSFLGDIIEPLVHEDFKLDFLNEVVEPIKGTQICVDLIVQILHSASNKHGHNSVLKMLKNSNIDVRDYLNHISNLDEFLNKNNLSYLSTNTRERTQSSSVSSESYEAKLMEILSTPKISNEKIFEMIESEFSEKYFHTKQFVRALVTSVCRICLVDNKFDQELFKKRSPILAKFIARDETLEVESLFAIQALDYQTKHQPGFIRVIFDMLYDEDIISEDAFRTWQSLDREDGHAISVLSLKAFFEWLDQPDVPEN